MELNPTLHWRTKLPEWLLVKIDNFTGVYHFPVPSEEQEKELKKVQRPKPLHMAGKDGNRSEKASFSTSGYQRNMTS